MEISGWDRVYQQQGQVQFEVLPKVKMAATKFRQKEYQRILDLACGTGRHTFYLAREGFYVYASDISEHGLVIARKQAEKVGLKIEFKRHDMKSIPYPTDFFDAVICIWSIDIGTLSDIRITINEIYRVLRKEGTLLTDFISVEDETHGKGKEIEKNTFVGAMPGLPDLIEHYTTREELVKLFSSFSEVKIDEADHFCTDNSGQNKLIKAFDVNAVK